MYPIMTIKSTIKSYLLVLQYIVKKLRVTSSKQKWILTELKFLNMLGFLGALGFFSDSLKQK